MAARKNRHRAFPQNMPQPGPQARAISPARTPNHARPKAVRHSIWRSPLIPVIAGMLVLSGLCVLSMVLGLGALYGSGRVLPGVHAAGIDLSSLREGDAAVQLAGWNRQPLMLRDGDRVWTALPGDLGIALDAGATAAAARAWGRSEGGLAGALQSITGGVNIEPVLSVDLTQLTRYLQDHKAEIDRPAQNAGVQLVNGQAVARPAQDGSELDVAATVARIQADAPALLADGVLDLVMQATAPAITDASALVAQANALLGSAFLVRGYDPIRDEWHDWIAPPEEWAAWLTAASDPASPTGLALTMNDSGPRAFLEARSSFGDERYLKIDEAVAAMQSALSTSRTEVTIRVWHGPTTVTVRQGQTLASIAEEVGIPYPYIQAENPGINVDALSVGQTLNLPSRDILVPLEPVPAKRIVVSRGQQRLRAYENGQVVFDWVISTGLPTSPTALGTFQIQSHEVNAYAQQWNLYMPHFMGFYHPGPNMDLMNGFHGFPTRGGGYLLWTDDLGRPVTYGCVLLSLENAATLFSWAEDGVVVVVSA